MFPLTGTQTFKSTSERAWFLKTWFVHKLTVVMDKETRMVF